MSERPISPLYSPPGGYGPNPGKASYEDFQNWLDDRRRLSTRRTDWKTRRKKLKITRRDPWVVHQIPSPPFRTILVHSRRKFCHFTVRQIISAARKRGDKRGELTEFEQKDLAARLTSWLTETYYADFLRCLNMGPFFFNLDLPKNHKEYFRKYVDYAFCAFVEFFRKDELHWKEGNKQDMRLARSLLGLFGGFDKREAKRQKFIDKLFDKRDDLEDVELLLRGKLTRDQYAQVINIMKQYPRWEYRIPELVKAGIIRRNSLAAYKKGGKVRKALVRDLQRLI